jgi:glycosyltransferase involved in cell wall biosynthesis
MTVSSPVSEHDRSATLRQLVVCSLEPWDDVWRRNQFFTDALLRRTPELRVLFVEPPADPIFDLVNRRTPTLPRVRSISKDGRLRGFRPLKPLPRRIGRMTDRALLDQVRLVSRSIGFSRPTLWINDVTYAALIQRTGWSSLYDVTDDWLLVPSPPRERERLRRLDELALAEADEVVVCSPALAVSRGANRAVTLVPNGVDVAHFRQPRTRPTDLPTAPTAVYLGTLHDARIDVELVAKLAESLPKLSIVFVGPNSLGAASQQLLEAFPNVSLLGQRPYRDAPAYLQHADIVIVPHRVSEFSDTLDPIKAYECLAIDTPTVATPVAGFRDYPVELNVVDRTEFVNRVAHLLEGRLASPSAPDPTDWQERAVAFERALLRASAAVARVTATNS